ncbi:hypothetical protein [Actinopolymorpha pittospori]|uniref:Multimeric flavodoxin WrbA n=1 Tax=Actinopolymorpha pittospori TaxID=648752 RepID=A0A927MP78_9ACTN|nr:hypothetical protein [Actinopolymorpha pittospori]MBE1604325.1 multimeric flavodoxin WrbA [Actinopolymorpha pittospori]
MRAVVLNCTLKPSPQESNTELLARVVMDEFCYLGVEVDHVRVVDLRNHPAWRRTSGCGCS